MTTPSHARAPLAAAAAAFVLASVVHAQWAPVDRLPGAESVQALRERAPASGARLSDVRWDVAGGRLWYQLGTK